MDREEFLLTAEFFLRLVNFGANVCADGEKGQPFPSKPEPVKWENVFMLANKHSLSALVFSCFQKAENPKDKPDGELYKHWENAYNFCVNTDILQEFAWEEIKDSFAEKKLKILPLKGLRTKSLYPYKALRAMGDLDILYEESRFKDVKSTLETLGYTFDKTSAESNHQVFFRPPVTHVEMHRALLPEESCFVGYFSEPWQRAVPKSDSPYVYEFSSEDEYIFLLVHAYKHFFGAGSGVRTIVDFYLFLKKYGNELNTGYIAEQIAKADAIAAARQRAEETPQENIQESQGTTLASFEKILLLKIEQWFVGKDVEIDDVGIEILCDGVYGKAENLWKRKCDKQGRKRYLRKRLFPPFKQMKKSFPVLNKVPLLLPFCWIARIFRALFVRKKQVLQEYKFVNDQYKNKDKK